MRKIYQYLLLGLLCWSGSAMAQERQMITGRVTSPDSPEGLPGVTVLVKGTSTGTITDLDGNFSVEATPSDTLVFSYVGYTPEDRPVGGLRVIDVQMVEDIKTLSDVVVVGYGQQQKEDVTGVVAKVEEESFNRGAIVSPDQLINGKIAGVNITQNSGEPGGQTSVRIRGGTSINANNEPLYVIDGVPIDNSPYNPGGLGTGRNPLNSLNPNDIASFTVLKDASATAIYGSRGANGVIIITTKRGEVGQAKVTYDNWFSIAEIARGVDVLDTAEFRGIVRELDNEEALNDTLAADTDWYDELFRTAYGQNHNLSISGGAKNTTYRVSLGYLDQEGILQNSRTQRTALSLNLGSKLLNDDLDVSLSLKGNLTTDEFAPRGPIGAAAAFDPTLPIRDPANTLRQGFFEYEGSDEGLAPNNPIAELAGTTDEGQSYRSIGNILFDYDLPFLDGLSAKLNLGYDVQRGARQRYLPTYLRSQRVDSGEARITNFTRTSTLLESYLTYNRYFESIESQIEVTGGYSYQDFNNEFPEFRAFNANNSLQDELGSNDLRFMTEFETFNTVLENRLISFFGRVNYSYKDRYLLTANFRRDGSTRFGPGEKFGSFPSLALGWRISQEPFMQGLTGTLSNLKLRASYGVVGNQEIGDYLFLPLYFPGGPRAQVPLGDRFVSTLRPDAYDPNLRWEQTTSYNIGIDYGLWAGRVYGSLEYYYKETNDLLFEDIAPAGANLANRQLTNVGSLFNEGVEAEINATVVNSSRVRWDVGVVGAYNYNEILSLTEGADSIGIFRGGIEGGTGNNVQILQIGQNATSFFVYEQRYDENGDPITDRFFDEDGDLQTRDLTEVYVDQNGDSIINDQDRRVFNQAIAPFTYGITSQVQAYNFDLSFTLRGSVGNWVYNNIASDGGAKLRADGEVPQNMHVSVLETGFFNQQYLSDYYVQRANFLRMDNITLGYTFRNLPADLGLRLYVTAQNLFVITEYEGVDPEIGNASNDPGNPQFGIDNNIYPRARTFLGGLSFTF